MAEQLERQVVVTMSPSEAEDLATAIEAARDCGDGLLPPLAALQRALEAALAPEREAAPMA